MVLLRLAFQDALFTALMPGRHEVNHSLFKIMFNEKNLKCLADSGKGHQKHVTMTGKINGWG